MLMTQEMLEYWLHVGLVFTWDIIYDNTSYNFCLKTTHHSAEEYPNQDSLSRTALWTPEVSAYKSEHHVPEINLCCAED